MHDDSEELAQEMEALLQQAATTPPQATGPDLTIEAVALRRELKLQEFKGNSSNVPHFQARLTTASSRRDQYH